MPMNDDRQHQNEEPDAPARLVAALHRLQMPSVDIPASVDEAILSQAKRHLCQSPGVGQTGVWVSLWERTRGALAISRSNRLKLVPWAAAAAALVLLVWLAPYNPFRPAVSDIEDVNYDGQVDILDAFALARQLHQGEQPRPQLDLNGDGVIDEQDISMIAARAVRLDRGRNSS